MLNVRHLLALVSLCACGCADIAPPRVFHPGTMEYQQGRAQRFDPYPMTDVAPAIGGGRPLQYDRPAPPTELMQDEVSFSERYHQAAPPGTYRPARSVGNRQSVVFPAPADPTMAPLFVP
jgi:hypothetical protein